jgi:hypothetical protein
VRHKLADRFAMPARISFMRIPRSSMARPWNSWLEAWRKTAGLCGGFGVGKMKNKDDSVKMRALFHMASITKPSVATAIFATELDAPVVKYLRWLGALGLPSEKRDGGLRGRRRLGACPTAQHEP